MIHVRSDKVRCMQFFQTFNKYLHLFIWCNDLRVLTGGVFDLIIDNR